MGARFGFDQFRDGFVQGRFAVLEIERHGPDGAAHAGHLAAGGVGDLFFDGRGVAQGGRHEQEGRLPENAQGDLPGDAALAVAVVVEFVHDHEVGGHAVMGTLRGFPNPPAMVRRRQSRRAPHAVMGTLRGFPNPPAMVRRRQSRRAPHAVMGTLRGFPNPPAMVRRRQSRRAPHAVMGTLRGFPNPPAMVRRRQSRRAPHAVMGTLRGFPNPPAMVRRRQSRRAPHAVMGTLRGFPNPPAMVRRRQSRRAPHAVRAAQGHVGQDLGGADQDRGVAVHRGVAGDQAHVLGAEAGAQVEELFVHQGLDRATVKAGLALAQGLVEERGGHQRLARSGRRGQHHVLAGQDLEQGFLLRGIERKPETRHVVEEPLEHLVAADGLGRWRERPRWRWLWAHVRKFYLENDGLRDPFHAFVPRPMGAPHPVPLPGCARLVLTQIFLALPGSPWPLTLSLSPADAGARGPGCWISAQARDHLDSPEPPRTRPNRPGLARTAPSPRVAQRSGERVGVRGSLAAAQYRQCRSTA